ncbi:MAG TPA: DEAD/DEAH box helicase [Verrucomicrobiae bacterium]|jgi:ATP-dependent Lhr-like helicase
METFQFHPSIARWFEGKFGTPTPPQERGWPAIQSGAHTLIAAPTGSGKTLAAFLASLDALFRAGLEGGLRDEIRVLYVSPLKALSNDIHKNLEEPLAEIRSAFKENAGADIAVRAEVRTGDTPAAKRQAIAKHPPHILVTTPESLYLLLTSVSGRKMLASVRTLIVDEIHAVIGSRRGSHLALSMERLAALAGGPLQRIGLSATQKPIGEVAKFLVGARGLDRAGAPRCRIIDAGHLRAMDAAIELPSSPLEAVMSNEVWDEVYRRLVQLIEAHRTTLVFVNTRRLAERVTHQLSGPLGADKVASHHGSLSTKLRLDAENRLKRGELKALVATSSLELGIDIGSVELVCQLGTTRSIAAFLQRIGRAEHKRGGLPKGRWFPLTRDELVECLATLRSIRRGVLDAIRIPEKPLDILAQQIVAAAASEDWEEDKLFDLARSAYPYRDLPREEFQEVVHMLAEGFSTKRGRRGALIHYDAVNRRIRGRRGARLAALTSGGAIPDNGDYRVVAEPGGVFIGTVNEDFAVESMAGEIFQLGNTSWKIRQIVAGTVRVEDARGQPPGIPFWLGEAPARTAELSAAVGGLRDDVQKILDESGGSSEQLKTWFIAQTDISDRGAQQLAEYFTAAYRALGVIPSQKRLVMERFFDESGGMQLVIHSPFGARLNRAWGLALRKRFCRSFNFELQAASTDDAIVLSLGTQHSFPLEEVFHYLHSKSVRDILVQALLDAPMFPIRWRWNATRSLALLRHRNGRKIPPALQRMESENLLAAVFPDQLACLENIVGDRQAPDHPLVRQTIEDCLTEAMDIEGLEALLRRIENQSIECVARDLPEPSPLAHEILNARPYAFLDNAPLEERRTQAVHTRRAGNSRDTNELGILDAAAIEHVCAEAWPQVHNADELHEALLLLGVMPGADLARCSPNAATFLAQLVADKRTARLMGEPSFWVAAERLSMARAVYPPRPTEPAMEPPPSEVKRTWEAPEALKEMVRGRMEIIGPIAAPALSMLFALPESEITAALLALEAEGFVLRGKFNPGARELEWCARRLLARIHRLTLNRLRAEIQPVSLEDFQRFLLAWQRAGREHRAEGPAGVQTVLDLLDGVELAAAAWEPEVLALRVKDYTPQWLDQLCLTGRVGWGRLSPSQNQNGRAPIPLRSTPISVFDRQHFPAWQELSGQPLHEGLAPDTELVLNTLLQSGAMFFGELVRASKLLPARVEQALGELAARGWATADSFEGLRALLVPSHKRASSATVEQKRRHKSVTSVEFAGRWALLRRPSPTPPAASEEAIEIFAKVFLRRYGVVFRRLLERESLAVSWYELGRICRRLEARGEIRGGHFIDGVSGEQFALPEAIGLLRSLRKAGPGGELIVINAADPLNLLGILTPGPRVTSITANRILLRDGRALAALAGGEIKILGECDLAPAALERALKVGQMAPQLRPYYA